MKRVCGPGYLVAILVVGSCTARPVSEGMDADVAIGGAGGRSSPIEPGGTATGGGGSTGAAGGLIVP